MPVGFIKEIADFLLPRTCHVCGSLLHDSEREICVRCIESLPRSRYHLMDMNPVERRFAGIVPFVRATGHFIYSRNSDLAAAIHDMKYRQFPRLGYRLGEIAGSELNMAGFFDGADCVQGVPMHWRKKARRGYNQADFIARGIADSVGLQVVDVLRAVRSHKTQTAMTLEQRQANLSGSFVVSHPDALKGRGLVIVDDVCTTGATMRTIASAVADAVPDCRIYLLSLCATV